MPNNIITSRAMRTNAFLTISEDMKTPPQEDYSLIQVYTLFLKKFAISCNVKK
jgi:hypothetical protein